MTRRDHPSPPRRTRGPVPRAYRPRTLPSRLGARAVSAGETSGEERAHGNVDLEPGEQELGHWTIPYLPPTGGKYAGKLVVTDRRVLDEPLKSGIFGRQDFSAMGVAGTLTVRTLVGQTTGTARACASRGPRCGLSRRGVLAA